MTTTTATAVEIVKSGDALVNEPGRKHSTGFTAHYDVVCPTCGPIASSVLYPTACKERADHLCRPRTRRG